MAQSARPPTVEELGLDGALAALLSITDHRCSIAWRQVPGVVRDHERAHVRIAHEMLVNTC
jgi:hypothetical protein